MNKRCQSLIRKFQIGKNYYNEKQRIDDKDEETVQYDLKSNMLKHIKGEGRVQRSLKQDIRKLSTPFIKIFTKKYLGCG